MRQGAGSVAWAGMVLVLSAGCVSQRTLVERDAVATYNRCFSALKQADLDMYRGCQSKRSLARMEAQRKLDAEAAPLDERGWMRGLADSAPIVTRIERSIVSEDLQKVTLQTINRSGVLSEAVDHHESIVLVRENGRWVIDKDCCEYSNARFSSPATEGPPETVPFP
jgi:hypothetical protein